MWNLTHAGDGNKERQELQYEPILSVFFFLKWDIALFFLVTHCWRLWFSCFHACEKRKKAFNLSYSVTGHFICMRWQGGGQVHPSGDPKPEGTGWCCTGLLATTTMVKTEWRCWRYYWSGVWLYLAARLVRGSISVAEWNRTSNGKNTKRVHTLDLRLWSF